MVVCQGHVIVAKVITFNCVRVVLGHGAGVWAKSAQFFLMICSIYNHVPFCFRWWCWCRQGAHSGWYHLWELPPRTQEIALVRTSDLYSTSLLKSLAGLFYFMVHAELLLCNIVNGFIHIIQFTSAGAQYFFKLLLLL